MNVNYDHYPDNDVIHMAFYVNDDVNKNVNNDGRKDDDYHKMTLTMMSYTWPSSTCSSMSARART